MVLTSPQDALDALHTTTRGLVFVDGVTVDAISWDCQFGVDQAVATARIVIPLPRPDTVVANAEVLIQGGHDDLVGPLFSGRIPAWDSAMTIRGDLLTVTAVGWLSLLNELDLYELTFDGPIALSALFDALCARRGIPSYRADATTDKTGTITIQYGGNPQLNDGKVILPDNQTLLTALNNRADIVGYRAYDTALMARLTRVSGAPNTDPVVTFTEGMHLLSANRRYDTSAIVNYPDVHGQTYEDDLGATVPIRAFPATVTADPLIPVNSGVRKRRIQSSLLETQQLAEIAMGVEQEDRAAPDTRVKWEAVAVPGLSVGDVVEVESETVEASGLYWLTDMDITSSSRGLTATYSGWRGGGTISPVGDNRVETLLQDGPFHIGDEVLTHYAVDSPEGVRKSWPFTIEERATAVNVVFWHHGTNSQNLNGVQTEIEVTRWAVYLPGEDPDDDDIRPQTSGYLPSLPEELSARRNYSTFTVDSDGNVTNPGYWKPGAVNLRSLDAGEYVLWILSGIKSGRDDMEARRVELHTYGVSEPVILAGEDL